MPRGVYQRAGAMPAEQIQDTPVEQKPDIVGDVLEHKPEVVEADPLAMKKEYMDELAFNEEPVTIHLMPSGAENAPTSQHCAVNGKGIEIFINGSWHEFTYAPIGENFTTKRKYVGVLLSSKIDKICTLNTDTADVVAQRENRIRRSTSPVVALSIIEDRNPRGREWVVELQRRNMG